MSSMFVSFFAATLMIVFNLVIPICIAVYVYQDAKKRGMEPILWALIAVVIPYFVGLVIYLVVRSGHSALHCAKCGAAIEEQYAVCPQCGADLKPRCSSCDKYVQADWQTCAYCGAALTPLAQAPVIEQPASNKGLWIVLAVAAALVVLLLLFVLFFGFFSFSGFGGHGMMGMGNGGNCIRFGL